MSRKAPPALKVVAMLFIGAGVLTLIEVLVSLTRAHISLDFGVLGIFIGQGLLRFHPDWHTCALVVLCLRMMSLFPFFTLLILDIFPLPIKFILDTASPFPIKFYGQSVGSASPGIVFVFAAFVFALNLWQYRVLTRRDIVLLFDEAVD